jgi:hypothetical protein
MTWWRDPKAFPLRIFLVALILRLVPVIMLQNMGIGLDDMFQYDMLARSLASGEGYRWYAQPDLELIQPYLHLDLTSGEYDPRGVLTSFRPPLYPFFLALIYLVTGVGVHRFFIVRLVQTVLSASLVPLTYFIGRRVFPNLTKVAVISAWVIAVYPMLVIYPLSLATENLFFVLLLGSILALFKAMDGVSKIPGSHTDIKRGRFSWWGKIHQARWFVISGLLLGALALTRSVSLVFAGLAVLWIAIVLRQGKMAVLVFATISLATLPWMVRNSLLHHKLTGIESALGYDLYVGYHPEGSGTFQYPQSLELMSILDDGVRDSLGREMAFEFIKADPARFPYLILRRAGYFFGLERRALTYFYSNDFFGYIPKALLIFLATVLCLPFTIVSTSSLLGLALTRWSRETILIALLFIGYITPHLLIISEDRFHLAIVPFLAIFASSTWVGSGTAIRERWQTRNGKIALLLASVGIILLLTNWGMEFWRDAGKLTQLFGPTGNQTFFPY